MLKFRSQGGALTEADFCHRCLVERVVREPPVLRDVRALFLASADPLRKHLGTFAWKVRASLPVCVWEEMRVGGRLQEIASCCLHIYLLLLSWYSILP